MGLSDYLDDPAFSPLTAVRTVEASRAAHLIDGWVAARARADTFHTLQELRVPAGYLTTADEVLELEQLRSREAFVRMEHPDVGALNYPGAPFKMSVTPFRTQRAPLLGEHNEQVYAGELQIAGAELKRLQQEGVI
jgi:crotonobetainyl-CoA:carnitine CoA-transferase CaiB-like acyl-CoA transferase